MNHWCWPVCVGSTDNLSRLLHYYCLYVCGTAPWLSYIGSDDETSSDDWDVLRWRVWQVSCWVYKALVLGAYIWIMLWAHPWLMFLFKASATSVTIWTVWKWVAGRGSMKWHEGPGGCQEVTRGAGGRQWSDMRGAGWWPMHTSGMIPLCHFALLFIHDSYEQSGMGPMVPWTFLGL